jgi:hypothetical protein
MIHDDEFDLTWADPPPAWVEAFGPLLEFWGNPIFQRRYVMWRLKPMFGPKKSFLIGLGVSFIINLFLLLVAEKELALEIGFWVTVAAPGIVIITVTSIRIFISSLVGTPLEMRRELFSGMLGAVLTTPMSDEKIFFAECISGLMRGFGAMEEVISMLIGLVVPFIVLMSPQLWPYVKAEGPASFWWFVLLLIAIIILIQVLLLASLSAGLMAIQLPVVATVPATLINTGLWFSVFSLIASWIAVFTMRFEPVRNLDILAIYLGIGTFLIASLTVACAVTGYLGVVAFAKARRPGWYGHERVNAAGLMSREERTRTSFGKSV